MTKGNAKIAAATADVTTFNRPGHLHSLLADGSSYER
jgi:hypothetical protein